MRTALTFLVVIVVALAIVLWSPPRERESSVAATVHPLDAADSTALPADLAEIEPERVAIVSTETRAPVHRPAVEKPELHAVISGRFVFEDGTVPPPLTFSVMAEPLENGEALPLILKDARVAPDEGRCVRHAEGRSGAGGGFEITGLCPRSYRFGQSTFSGLTVIEGRFHAPARDIEVVLDGYLLRVLVVDESTRPVADAEVAVSFRVGATHERKGRLESKTHLLTDTQGTCLIAFPDPGLIEIDASAGLRHVSDHHAGVGGRSGLLTRTLVLGGAIQGASLAIRVLDCSSARTPLDSYCLAFFDVVDGRRAFRLDSKNAGPGGTFRNLVPGRYKVRLEGRSADEPLMYRLSVLTVDGGTDYLNMRGEVISKLIELIDQQEAQFSMCVEHGGRLAVRITAAAGVDLIGPDSRLDLVAGEGSKPLTLEFRSPAAGT